MFIKERGAESRSTSPIPQVAGVLTISAVVTFWRFFVACWPDLAGAAAARSRRWTIDDRHDTARARRLPPAVPLVALLFHYERVGSTMDEARRLARRWRRVRHRSVWGARADRWAAAGSAALGSSPARPPLLFAGPAAENSVETAPGTSASLPPPPALGVGAMVGAAGAAMTEIPYNMAETNVRLTGREVAPGIPARVGHGGGRRPGFSDPRRRLSTFAFHPRGHLRFPATSLAPHEGTEADRGLRSGPNAYARHLLHWVVPLARRGIRAFRKYLGSIAPGRLNERLAVKLGDGRVCDVSGALCRNAPKTVRLILALNDGHAPA
jgi:hypothetical protein